MSVLLLLALSVHFACQAACAALSSATSEQPLKGDGVVAPLDHISLHM